MRFLSTRGQAPSATLSEALRNGAAPDGGLYMPEKLPQVDLESLRPAAPLAEFAAVLLRPFFAGDLLERELPAICAEALNFPAALVTPDPAKPTLQALELFHGPTGAFKDFGARFLMGCFDRISSGDTPLTVLAATSGDTGGAVGCAAEDRSSVRAVVLFPKGRVSAFQERQLCCWGKQVLAVEVEGDFDDCQRLVKAAFKDQDVSHGHRLTSANSINFGRLMPQLAYAAHAALQVFTSTGEKPGYIVPSGNLGHGFAVLLARAMGIPIGPVVLASNANRTLKEWQLTGRFEPRAAIQTLANAMDVGNPSNFERIAAMPPKARDVDVELVRDDEIRSRIKAEYDASGYVYCPHSATAVEAWCRLPYPERSERPWIAAATAHPYKFADIVEPLINRIIEPSPALAAILSRPRRTIRITADLDSLVEALQERAEAA
jgi:threonine synthase